MHIKTIDGQNYLYSTRREHGRIVSECHGAVAADLAALIRLDIRLRRAQREAERARREAERRAILAEIAEQERPAVEFFRAVDAALREALISFGYHQTHRGPWRRKRMSDRKRYRPNLPARMPGVEECIPDLCRVIDLSRLGEIGATAQLVMVDQAASKVILARRDDDEPRTQEDLNRETEAIDRGHRRIREMAAELAGPDASPIDRLLAERAAFCWYDLQRSDLGAETALIEGDPFKIEHHERRRSRAQARYLSALKALATVRRIDLAGFQLNIGDKQVIAPPPPKRARAKARVVKAGPKALDAPKADA